MFLWVRCQLGHSRLTEKYLPRKNKKKSRSISTPAFHYIGESMLAGEFKPLFFEFEDIPAIFTEH
jgi:hypothetical protein